jgi:hypothetical protein
MDIVVVFAYFLADSITRAMAVGMFFGSVPGMIFALVTCLLVIVDWLWQAGEYCVPYCNCTVLCLLCTVLPLLLLAGANHDTIVHTPCTILLFLNPHP